MSQIGFIQPPSQWGVNTLRTQQIGRRGIVTGVLVVREGKEVGPESQSMKETVPVPYPMCVAWLALLLHVLCYFPFLFRTFGAALPHSPALWATQVSALRPGLALFRAEVQVHSLLAAVGLVAPLQVLHLFRGGFAHSDLLQVEGLTWPDHLPLEGPEQLLCSLCAI